MNGMTLGWGRAACTQRAVDARFQQRDYRSSALVAPGQFFPRDAKRLGRSSPNATFSGITGPCPKA
jgi:hypothetical protein